MRTLLYWVRIKQNPQYYMKKFSLYLIPVLIVTCFVILGSNTKAEAQSVFVCPTGYVCTPSTFVCPVGYTCVPNNVSNQNICPEGYICTQTNIPRKENLLFKIISKIMKFMPATVGWARQFVHEEDIVSATLAMCFTDKKFTKVEKYNLCPTVKTNPKNYIDAKEMGEILRKKVIYLHPQIVRLLCFLAWHGTWGKVPTSSGVWKAYAYPINVDGSKVERDFPEFKYRKDIREAYLG
jgi:hypothetical protein